MSDIDNVKSEIEELKKDIHLNKELKANTAQEANDLQKEIKEMEESIRQKRGLTLGKHNTINDLNQKILQMEKTVDEKDKWIVGETRRLWIEDWISKQDAIFPLLKRTIETYQKESGEKYTGINYSVSPDQAITEISNRIANGRISGATLGLRQMEPQYRLALEEIAVDLYDTKRVPIEKQKKPERLIEQWVETICEPYWNR